jgi:hypothetical protein
VIQTACVLAFTLSLAAKSAIFSSRRVSTTPTVFVPYWPT